jgi:hypothetical protein
MQLAKHCDKGRIKSQLPVEHNKKGSFSMLPF